jgi:hypothetical protein
MDVCGREILEQHLPVENLEFMLNSKEVRVYEEIRILAFVFFPLNSCLYFLPLILGPSASWALICKEMENLKNKYRDQTLKIVRT